MSYDTHPCYKAAQRLMTSAIAIENKDIPDAVICDYWLKTAFGIYALTTAVGKSNTKVRKAMEKLHEQASNTAKEYVL